MKSLLNLAKSNKLGHVYLIVMTKIEKQGERDKKKENERERECFIQRRREKECLHIYKSQRDSINLVIINFEFGSPFLDT